MFKDITHFKIEAALSACADAAMRPGTFSRLGDDGAISADTESRFQARRRGPMTAEKATTMTVDGGGWSSRRRGGRSRRTGAAQCRARHRSLAAHWSQIYSFVPSLLYCAPQPAVFHASLGFEVGDTAVTDTVAG